jgi:hypothetical protein
MKKIFAASLGLALAVSVQAQTGTFTDTFSDFQFLDGGSLNGTISINFVAGRPTAIDSFDIVTGTGSTESGNSYIYNLPGANVTSITMDQISGAGLDNEIHYVNSGGSMYFDYVLSAGQLQLWVSSNFKGNYTSEDGNGERAIFAPQASGTQVTTVPEPTTLALAGLGAAGLLIFRRRK